MACRLQCQMQFDLYGSGLCCISYYVLLQLLCGTLIWFCFEGQHRMLYLSMVVPDLQHSYSNAELHYFTGSFVAIKQKHLLVWLSRNYTDSSLVISCDAAWCLKLEMNLWPCSQPASNQKHHFFSQLGSGGGAQGVRVRGSVHWTRRELTGKVIIQTLYSALQEKIHS